MDNALKFDKVERAAARPVSTASPPTWSPSSNNRSVGPPQGRPQVPEAGRADQEVRRPQGPALDLAERGQVPRRVRPRRRRGARRRPRRRPRRTEEEEVHRAGGLGVRLLQRRGRPDRRRLPDPRLEGPGRGAGKGQARRPVIPGCETTRCVPRGGRLRMCPPGCRLGDPGLRCATPLGSDVPMAATLRRRRYISKPRVANSHGGRGGARGVRQARQPHVVRGSFIPGSRSCVPGRCRNLRRPGRASPGWRSRIRPR